MYPQQPNIQAQIKSRIRYQIPKSVEELRSLKYEQNIKMNRYREELRMGRRMVSCTHEYEWDATARDWVLEEMKWIAVDTISRLKWKKAAAYKLAKAAQVAVSKIMEEWRYKETTTRLVALKTSAIIKQAFYNQYTNLKKAKKENTTVANVDIRKAHMGKRLQAIMRWIIVNYEFQYEIPIETYNTLCKKINTNAEKKTGSTEKSVTTLATQNSPNERDQVVLKFSSYRMGPEGAFTYDSFEFNGKAPSIMLVNTAFAENLLEQASSSSDDQLTNINLANLMEVPSCDYDEIVNSPLIITGSFKSRTAEATQEKATEDKEQEMLEDLQEIFLIEPESSENSTKTKKITSIQKDTIELLAFFDINKALKHKIYTAEDEEFMDYIRYLPEYDDIYFQDYYHKKYFLIITS